ncbi:C-X-C chemokine receptor type 4 [Channa argus]|uniref:C-X-C chemokine receptor type 4 n=1 Tax=Channa argus TaxID=215402 RepID=A0A6G1QJL8_CHAAH|nr:C-X-C chemokine receptor type 4 [Channa argus]KAK2890270.1 hypothetical protein Q8A73_018570 [Channa argus]
MEQINSTVDTVNISSSPAPPVAWEASALVPAIILSLCFLLGVPGNIAVILLKSKWLHLSSLSQNLMLNLAVSDLLCLVTLPLWIYDFLWNWIFSLVACKLISYLVYCSIYSSLLTVTSLSVQRYLKVVYMHRCLDQRKQNRLLVLLWLVSMILSIPMLIVSQLTQNQQGTHCRPQYILDTQLEALLLIESLVGFLSLFVVTFAYICIARKVRKLSLFKLPRTTRLSTSIILTFFVLWLPNHTINVLGVVAVSQKNEGLFKLCMDSWNLVGALTFVNSCMNPILYTYATCNM